MVYLILLIELAIFAAIVAGGWKAFVKAGLPGWAFLVPIYNFYLVWQMTGKPILWFILLFVPLVNIVVLVEVAKAYGKGTGVAVALMFGVGWPILGFGDATYQGKAIEQGIPQAALK